MEKNYTTNLLQALKPKMRYVLSCCLLFTASHAFSQSEPWIIYNASVFPNEMESNAFITSSVSPSVTATAPAIVESEQFILVDPVDASNKLLHMKIAGNPHTSFHWRQNFASMSPTPTALTVVIRAKGLPNVDRVLDVDLDLNKYREMFQILSNGNVNFNYGKAGDPTLANRPMNIDALEWHTYRFTLDGSGNFSMYVDENAVPIGTVTIARNESSANNHFRFGDNGGTNVNIGAYVDYVLWTTEGAYSPAVKAVPAGTLTKLSSVDAASAKVSVYPNPVKGGQAKLGLYLQSSSDVSVQIFDLAGRKIGQSVNFTNMKAGQNEVNLPVTGLKEGTYLYQISTNRYTTTQKVFIR